MIFFTLLNLLLLPFLLLPVISFGWIVFNVFLRRRVNPACAIEIIAELLIVKYGAQAVILAEKCEEAEWQRSRRQTALIWQQVRRELQRRWPADEPE